MKTIATFILSLFIGVQFLAAQEKQVQQAQPAQQVQPAQQTQQVQQAQPKPGTISWSETTHDFGKIPVNNPASVTFTVKNSGTEPIVMSAAKSSCGCTVAEFTKEPIKPGESGVVKATYNAAHPGPFTKTVTVTFAGIANADVLVLKGEVIGEPTPPPSPTTPPQPAPAPATKPGK